MPIDYLSRREASRGRLSDLVRGRNIEDELSRSAAAGRADRSAIFSGIEGFTPGISRTLNARAPELEREADARYGEQRLTMRRRKMSQIFNNLYDEAVAAGADQRSAEDYASRIAEQVEQQEEAARLAEKSREHERKKSRVANEYADRGVALEQSYAGGGDYTGALIGALLGAGTSIGTSAILRKQALKDQERMFERMYGQDNSTRLTGDYSPGTYLSRMIQSFDDEASAGYRKKSLGNYGIRSFKPDFSPLYYDSRRGQRGV